MRLMTTLPIQLSDDLREAIRDVRNRENLNGPYSTAREAIDAMLEE